MIKAKISQLRQQLWLVNCIVTMASGNLMQSEVDFRVDWLHFVVTMEFRLRKTETVV